MRCELAAALLALVALPARAATYTAASCNEIDVQNAYAQEQANKADGDVIRIPAGTCTWSSAWVISPTNSIMIQGAGAQAATDGGTGTTGSDVTTVVMASNDSAHDYEIMNVTTLTGKLFRITGIAFSFPNGNTQSQNGIIAITGNTQSLRIDHNHFIGYGGHWIETRGWIYGVLDHNVIDGFLTADNWVGVENGANWNGDPNGIGDQSWADFSYFGSNKFLFMEDNRFISNNGVTSYTNDCSRGGRQVVRYNTFVGAVVTQGHGPKGDDQGCRATEMYGNTGLSPNGGEIGVMGGVLSGPALIWGNTLDLVKIIYSLYDGRKGDGSPQGNMATSWSMCQHNDPGTLYQGTVNTNGTAVTWISGGTFLTHWPTLSAATMVINGVSYTISSCTSTTACTLSTSAGNQTGVNYYVPSQWDGNTDFSGYPCISQPARGKGDLITGVFLNSTRLDSVTGTVTWPHQALDPIYAWANTNTWPGDTQDAVVGVSPIATNLKENRDFYQQMAGYCFGGNSPHNSCGANPSGVTLSPGQTLPFTGAAGIGQGLLSARPTTCTAGTDPATGGSAPGVGYWATDQGTWNQSGSGGQGQLYVCSAPNTWTLYYTPYTYPHPLTAAGAPPPPAPSGPPWSGILDPSRAIDWTSAGFTIPNYTSNCPTQPSLVANDPNAAADNKTAIENALASCDASHHVVNIPAGTYYIAGWTYGPQGHQVVRGAGPNSTTLVLTAQAPCAGLQSGVCMIDGNPAFDGSGSVLPPSGTRQCLWTAGYAQGSTTITLSSCGGTPPVNQTLVLDQADDTSDTGGIYMCSANTAGCTVEPSDLGGRTVNGIVHDQQQVVYVTGVTSLGGGSYSVNITPGVYFNNVRSSQSPGAWWPGFVQNDGLENLTLNAAAISNGTVEMFNCYQCWARNIRSLYGGIRHLYLYQSAQDVVRDSYFYGAQGTGSSSYGIAFSIDSGCLVENNIFQQLVTPVIFGVGTGNVVGYNFGVNSAFAAPFFQAPYYGHGSGTQMGLWEGNNFLGIWTDAVHGSAATGTFFRNLLIGWQSGKTSDSIVIPLRSWQRANNVVGNVLGQPGYHTTYESYATSPTGGVNAASAYTSIYELGWSDDGGLGLCTGGHVVCDPLVRSTLMRWGNYDVVTGGIKWDSTEASPVAVPYVNANFTSTYFSSLAHGLPASLYYSSQPSWWPATKPWPPVGPDVSSGNLGTCSGTYAGAQATTSAQCAGGALTSAWASHANSIPAHDCYLNVMHGPPDGSGNVLPFDAAACYPANGATTSACDVNGDGLTNVIDVQQTVNQALGLGACTADINKDGRCDVIDVQRVVNAALGGACVGP